jgi:ATP-binding protein involved in chromosome partitioning
MSYLDINGERSEIFGSGGGELVAKNLTELSGKQVKLLAKVPISVPLREGSDKGMPLLSEQSHDPAAIEIAKIAKVLAESGLGLAGKKLPLATI